jgi:hypothetical protein
MLKFQWVCQVMKFVTEEKNMIQNNCLNVTQQLKHVPPYLTGGKVKMLQLQKWSL